MSGRASKKLRRLSTDSEGTEEGLDLIGLRGKPQIPRSSGGVAGERNGSRGRTASENISTATVSRGPASGASLNTGSMRLTVKTSSSKLREATRSSPISGGAGAIPLKSARDPFIGGEIVEGKRARNVKKSYVLESESEDEEDEDEVMEDLGEEDADAEGESIDEDDLDADGDIDMDIPTPPVIKVVKAPSGKQSIVVKPPPQVDNKTVEQKEVEDESDEELSELDSDLGEVEEEEAMQTGNEDDAEGEDVEEEDEEEVELDSDDEDSRASTPDLSKLTKRQRAALEEGGSGFLLALPDEVQVKKHLTAEEHAMRRAEMARRRKNLSEKRNEEEKMETINKLLKKQAPKTNARRNLLNNVGADGVTEAEVIQPDFVRWISNKDGNRIGVPQEWVDAPVGDIFKNSTSSAGMGGKLIQEVA